MTYGHALHLLGRCPCGAVASFRHDDTGQPCCRRCYEETDMSAVSKPGWTFSPGVIDKARSYLAQRRVQADAEADGVFWVRGSDPRRQYRVQTDADPETQRATWIACTCSHGLHAGAGAARCSHAVAVLLAVRDRLPLEISKRG